MQAAHMTQARPVTSQIEQRASHATSGPKPLPQELLKLVGGGKSGAETTSAALPVGKW